MSRAAGPRGQGSPLRHRSPFAPDTFPLEPPGAPGFLRILIATECASRETFRGHSEEERPRDRGPLQAGRGAGSEAAFRGRSPRLFPAPFDASRRGAGS